MLPYIANRPLSLVRCPARRRQALLLPEARQQLPPARHQDHRHPGQNLLRARALHHPRHPRSHRLPRPDERPRNPSLGLHQRRPRAPRPPHLRPRSRRRTPLAHRRRRRRRSPPAPQESSASKASSNSPAARACTSSHPSSPPSPGPSSKPPPTTSSSPWSAKTPTSTSPR